MNKGKTMGLVLAILGISACLVPQAWAIPMARLDITVAGLEVSEVTVGSSFDLDVVVYEEDPLALEDYVAAFGFVTTLLPDTNPDAFTINQIELPDGIDPDLIPDLPASYPDQYISGIANADPLVPITFGEDTLLATLNITANAVGLFEMGIVSDLESLFEGLFTIFSDDPFDLTSSTGIYVSPVPEPGTVVLLLVGIGGLGIVKRRRS